MQKLSLHVVNGKGVVGVHLKGPERAGNRCGWHVPGSNKEK